MPKLIIDEHEIEVEPGTKVITAAEQLGIMIPRFCYHPALGSVGACRVCAVKFLEGPVKGVQMSCMVSVRDGMVVSTTDSDAVDFRRHVIEWLMMNHPHDCPVCDEGGHCLLQDMTVSGGHSLRRYSGTKRTYPDQYLGPLLQHEMNRCIHCYRCSRYYQEFSGYHDLGVMRSANRTYFGRFSDGRLESPFAGNLSDICPTGVYTDKPSRFFGRRWDYQRSSTLCINCSLGCNTVSCARYREVVRQEARYNRVLNGYFICDRGRYGFFYNSSAKRPRHARVDGSDVSVDVALRIVKEKLDALVHQAGCGSIAAAGSTRSTLENITGLERASNKSGWQPPAYFQSPRAGRRLSSLLSSIDAGIGASLEDVGNADLIISLGADPVNEAPMLALAIRQAQRKGAPVMLIDPRPIDLACEYSHLAMPSGKILIILEWLLKETFDPGEFNQKTAEFLESIPTRQELSAEENRWIAVAAEKLKTCRKPVVICGAEIASPAVVRLSADFARLLRLRGQDAGFFGLAQGANAVGAACVATPLKSFVDIIESIEANRTKVLFLVENDPYHFFPDRQRLNRALDKLDLLVVLDYLVSEAAMRAHVFLPTATLYETGGVFINQAGWIQVSEQVLSGGEPIIQTGQSNHPPREYGAETPGAAPQAAWRVLAEIAGDEMNNSPRLLINEIPERGELPPLNKFPDSGLQLAAVRLPQKSPEFQYKAMDSNYGDTPAGQIEIILADRVFGTEELSMHSPCLQEFESDPAALMHAQEAQRLGLKNNDRLLIHTGGGELEIRLITKDKMALGTLVIPRHHGLNWQIFNTGRLFIDKGDLKKTHN